MHIHILGIAGTKTTPLAKILQSQGHTITGSDQTNIYPPISTILKHTKIPLNTTPITPDIDLVIVGNSFNSFNNCRQEFDQIKSQKIPYISYTDYLVTHLIKENSILIAGSYGKTTITGLLSEIFLGLGLDPSFMFGGEPVNSGPSTRFGNSNWSIVEADENKNGLDTQATFIYYPVKYLILTSVTWEHKETYPTPSANLESYKQLIKKIPSNGVLVYNPKDSQILKLLPFCQGKTIPYQTDININTQLIGQHNQENISAALTLCHYLKLDEVITTQSINNFLGIKRRLEIVSNKNNILIIDDFAQSSQRTVAAIDAVRQSYPNRPIYVYFEPHATLLQYKNSLTGFEPAFKNITQVILGKIQFNQKVSKNERSTARDWTTRFNNLTYIPDSHKILEYFTQKLHPNDILIHFSSGGQAGLNTLKSISTYFNQK